MPDGAIGTRTHLGLGDHGRKIGEEEYLEAGFEDPFRYELSRGRLSVMSPKSEEHDDTAEPWLEHLFHHKRMHPGIIQRIVPEAWVRIGPKDYRIGDIGVYLVGERSAQKRPARAPELMIEVLSWGRDAQDRDLLEKRSEYHAIGILEYVIVDGWTPRVLVLAHGPDGYAERVLTEADTYATPLLPGFEVRLSEVL